VGEEDRPSRERRRRVAEAGSSLRDLRVELAVLNHRVGARVRLRDLDFDCLDIIARRGPLTPSSLAGQVGVHLATMTGILDRLETGGWITRAPVENDRRAVLIKAAPDRQGELYGLFDAMNTRLAQICEGYTDQELDTILDFLKRTVAAGRASADDLRRDLLTEQ
jgi:DNA-binding MarR family transcriptional regulator